MSWWLCVDPVLIYRFGLSARLTPSRRPFRVHLLAQHVAVGLSPLMVDQHGLRPQITKTYDNTPFVFREGGWFNMTKAAQHFGKRLQHFLDKQETKDYIRELALVTHSKESELSDARKGSYGGIWAHPKLAVFVARWLDVKFAVWRDAALSPREQLNRPPPPRHCGSTP